jgi:hypothetical protein
MQKVEVRSGKVHFAMAPGSDYLACLARRATSLPVSYVTPITCKRCFTMRVHDVPSALVALGIIPEDYVSYQARRVGRDYVYEELATLPGGESIDRYQGATPVNPPRFSRHVSPEPERSVASQLPADTPKPSRGFASTQHRKP